MVDNHSTVAAPQAILPQANSHNTMTAMILHRLEQRILVIVLLVKCYLSFRFFQSCF